MRFRFSSFWIRHVTNIPHEPRPQGVWAQGCLLPQGLLPQQDFLTQGPSWAPRGGRVNAIVRVCCLQAGGGQLSSDPEKA